MKNLLILSTTALFTLSACKKEFTPETGATTNSMAEVSASKMTDIKVPNGFKWETSRDVMVKIATTDNNFGGSFHKLEVYTANPAQGGKKVAEGSISTNKPFEAKIQTAFATPSFFLVKIAPDGSKVMEKVSINGNTVNATMTVSTNKSLGKTSGPDCSTGCSNTVNNPSGNVTYSSGTVCLTGSVSINNLTLQSNVVVRICGTGTINNLNMNGTGCQLIITSSGNINFTSSTPFDEAVINYGVITSDANANININSTGSLTNYGTVHAGKDFNPNGSSVIVNNGTIEVDNKLINNSGSDFTNNCKLIVHDNFDNNGLFKNYGYVRCDEEATIQGGSNNEFKQYNGAMLSTKDIQVNGTITGFGTTSLIKVSAQSKGNAQGLVNGAQNYCDVNGIEGPWNATINGGASQSCSLNIPVSACNPEGNGVPAIQDTDGDGVSDDNDCYPNDPNKAYCNNSGNATVAFEDLWPYRGDYDLNDVVVRSNYTVITNAANQVVRVEAQFVLRATGGTFNNGFGVQFPVNRNQVSGVSGASLEAGQSKAVLIIFNDMRSEMQDWNTLRSQVGSPVVTYNVAFNITGSVSLASFGVGGYNPFIWNGSAGFGRGYEIHLPGKLPTDLANTELFGSGQDATNVNSGTTYVTKDGGYPWAISIPGDFDYAVEKADINTAYLKFATWVSSNGAAYADWYANTSGYRNTENIY